MHGNTKFAVQSAFIVHVCQMLQNHILLVCSKQQITEIKKKNQLVNRMTQIAKEAR